jgi:hypothetical protein
MVETTDARPGNGAGALDISRSALASLDCVNQAVEIDSASLCGSGKGMSNTGGVSSFNSSNTQSA